MSIVDRSVKITDGQSDLEITREDENIVVTMTQTNDPQTSVTIFVSEDDLAWMLKSLEIS